MAEELILPGGSENIEARMSRVVAAFLEGRTDTTLSAYRRDLRYFSLWTHSNTMAAMAAGLLSRSLGSANELVHAYRGSLIESGLAPSTINRRLASIRSLVTFAQSLGLVEWSLLVPNVRQRSYRDTRGPGRAGFHLLIREARASNWPGKPERDVAILHLLFDLGLRRCEVEELDVESVNFAEHRVMVRNKGTQELAPITLPAPTERALAEWMDTRDGYVLVRSANPALFICLDHGHFGSRLTGRSIHRMVSNLGREASIVAWPHGLRHSAITEALDLTGGDVRAVQQFSRHADPRTVLRYDDNRRDLAGQVARLVAGGSDDGSTRSETGERD